MKIIFTKISDGRNREFAIKTSIAVRDGRKIVVKEPLFSEGAAHVRRILDNERLLTAAFPAFGIGGGHMEDGRFVTDFLEGELLSERFKKLAQKGDQDAFFQLFGAQMDLLTNEENLCTFHVSPEFESWFGTPDPATAGTPAWTFSFFDATAANIIFPEGWDRPSFIDYEWCFSFPLPVFLITYHLIDLLYQIVANLEELIPREVFFTRHLSSDEIKWADVLQNRFYERVHRQDGVSSQEIFSRYRKSDGYVYEDVKRLNQLAAEQGQHILDQDGRIRRDERIIDEQRADMQQMENSLREQAEHISAQDVKIGAQDQQIREKTAEIKKISASLAKRSSELSRARTDLQSERSRSRKRLATIRTLKKRDARLKKILRSRSWRYARKIARVVRLFFPRKAIHTRLIRSVLRFVFTPLRRKKAIQKYKPLSFPVSDHPIVSIIIPVHNQFSYTYNCLKSVLETCEGMDYEVIVTDDASKDATRWIRQIVQGVRLIRNKPALLFLKNCNQAAKEAQGQYYMFLNNDTIVHEDWLQSMVLLMEQDDRTGIVGSKLLFRDGKLQEAGGIIWSDASGWNYGRRQSPEGPEYNYVRETDYVSGCSLLIRRTLWEDIGGFDERYAPAYFEDSDLAFEARRRGFKVMYQPASVVTHFEGVSNGTDVTTGIKAYQVTNHSKFVEKWADTLEKGQYPNGQCAFRARERSAGKKIVLFTDNNVPTHDKDAGSRTMYEYMKLYLDMGYKVILLPLNFHRLQPYTKMYQQMGVEVLYGPRFRQNIFKWLEENKDEIDLYFLARPHVAEVYIDFIREHSSAPILFYGMDVHFLRMQREYELKEDAALLPAIEKSRTQELALIRKVDAAFYPSIEEERFLKEICPEAKVSAVPAFVLDKIQRKRYEIKDRKGLIFVGGFFHQPNGDAVLWFVNEILPVIQQSMPEIVFHVVGSNAPEKITALASGNVRIHGYLETEELMDLYQTVRMAVVPLRYGAGIKGKVVEAMSVGLPVITTPIGSEGFVDAEDYLAVVEESMDFASKVVTLYEDKESLQYMVDKSYDYLENAFAPEKVMSIFEKAASQTETKNR